MEEKEREVRISDLIALLLKKTGAILCTALFISVLGGLIGAFQAKSAISDSSVIAHDLAEAELAVSVAEDNLAKAQKDLLFLEERSIPDTETDIERALELQDYLRNYAENSIYYSIDAFNCGVSRLTFSMKTGNDTEAERVTGYIGTLIFDTEELEQVRSILGVDSELSYVRELISVIDEGGGFYTIRIVFDDPQRAEEAVDDLYESLADSLKSTRSNYSSTVVSRFTGYEIDLEMNENQNKVYDEMVDAARTVMDLRDQLPELKKQTDELENAVEVAEYELNAARLNYEKKAGENSGMSTGQSGIIKKAIKYAAVFFVGGLICSCLMVVCAGLFSGKLQNKNDICQIYSYPVVGVIPRAKPYTFEKTIRALEGDSLSDRSAGIKTVAQSLLSITEGKKVCLISSAAIEAAKELSAALDGKIPVCGNILEDASAVKALDDFESLVLVEQRGLSRIDLITDEIKLAEAMGKTVLGFVLT